MREVGEARAEELVEKEAVEKMADVGAPMREELDEVGKHDLPEQLNLVKHNETYQQAVRAVEEVLVVVQERDHLLQNLQVRHRDQLLQRVDQIHVVQLVLEFTVVIRTNLRVREVLQLLWLDHVEQRRAEPTLVFDWLQHPTTLQQTQKVQPFPAGRDHVYEINKYSRFLEYCSPTKTESLAAA